MWMNEGRQWYLSSYPSKGDTENVQGNTNFLIIKTTKKFAWYVIHNHLVFNLLNKNIQTSARQQSLSG